MKRCLRELILKITDLYKQKTTKNSAIIHYLYDPLVLLVSNNAYRSFTLNLKPLNQIIKVVYKAGGTGVQGGIFFSQILTYPNTTRAVAYYAHEIITCPHPPKDF